MSLEKTLENLEKRFGSGAVMKMGQNTALKIEAIPTGSLSLDRALGIGGLPKGRIVEIYGPESSGKTTLCQHVIAEAQKEGGICAFIDMEHALDKNYTEACGVNINDLYVSQPSNGEEALEIAEMLIKSGCFSTIVIDSVAALVPRKELEEEMGQSHIGLQARLMSQACRKLSGIVKDTNTLLIFTNQLRHKIGVMFGSPETTPGGNALKYYASVRLDIRRIKTIKRDGGAVANEVRVKVKKNKVSPPFKEAIFEIEYGTGISMVGELLDLGVEYDIINKRGAYYRYGEILLGQGKEKAKAFLLNDPKIFNDIETAIRSSIYG